MQSWARPWKHRWSEKRKYSTSVQGHYKTQERLSKWFGVFFVHNYFHVFFLSSIASSVLFSRFVHPKSHDNSAIYKTAIHKKGSMFDSLSAGELIPNRFESLSRKSSLRSGARTNSSGVSVILMLSPDPQQGGDHSSVLVFTSTCESTWWTKIFFSTPFLIPQLRLSKSLQWQRFPLGSSPPSR